MDQRVFVCSRPALLSRDPNQAGERFIVGPNRRGRHATFSLKNSFSIIRVLVRGVVHLVDDEHAGRSPAILGNRAITAVTADALRDREDDLRIGVLSACSRSSGTGDPSPRLVLQKGRASRENASSVSNDNPFEPHDDNFFDLTMTPTMRFALVSRLILLSAFATFHIAGPDVAAQNRLRLSDDHRRIVTDGGEPFFWLGDTAWELFHRLDRPEADLYLEDRARKGFNVIQGVVLAELDGLHAPNPYGETPLIDDDPARPNEAYFEHVDYIVDKADELEIFIGMLPTWGDKFNKRWGVGPEVFTPENARAYGRFLGDRYKDSPIVWILGGDRPPDDEEDLAIIRAMADGIRSGDAGAHLMTYHPMGGRKSWEWFHEDEWLDFNFFQSGHGTPDAPNYEFTQEGYVLQPVKPVIDGEPRYEDHPISWNPERGWYGPFDVRQAGYWSVLAGAAGHTYGNHNIWQMWEPGREPISSARTPWHVALAHAGAAQMGFMKRLFQSRPFLTLVPDLSLVDPAYDGPRHIRAARSRDGRTMIAYSPYGWPIQVDLEKLSGAEVRAWWFDPRTGASTEIGAFERSGQRTFDPPGEGKRGNDWVLVVDDAAAGFQPPGL